MVSILWLIEAKNKYLFLLLALSINQSLLKMNMNNKQYILPYPIIENLLFPKKREQENINRFKQNKIIALVIWIVGYAQFKLELVLQACAAS